MSNEKRSDILMYTITQDGRERTLLSVMPLDDGFERGIPSEAILGELHADANGLSEENFTPNVAFIKFMHESIATHVRSCPSLIERARRLAEGQLPLLDARVPKGRKQVNAADVIGIIGSRRRADRPIHGLHATQARLRRPSLEAGTVPLRSAAT